MFTHFSICTAKRTTASSTFSSMIHTCKPCMTATWIVRTSPPKLCRNSKCNFIEICSRVFTPINLRKNVRKPIFKKNRFGYCFCSFSYSRSCMFASLFSCNTTIRATSALSSLVNCRLPHMT